ncbi:MAG: hypothetical protein ABEJ46_02760, partial [Gemmatimonadota bacterium]
LPEMDESPADEGAGAEPGPGVEAEAGPGAPESGPGSEPGPATRDPGVGADEEDDESGLLDW